MLTERVCDPYPDRTRMDVRRHQTLTPRPGAGRKKPNRLREALLQRAGSFTRIAESFFRAPSAELIFNLLNRFASRQSSGVAPMPWNTLRSWLTRPTFPT